MNFFEFIEQQQERNVFLVLWSIYWRFMVVVAVMWMVLFAGLFVLTVLLTGLAGI